MKMLIPLLTASGLSTLVQASYSPVSGNHFGLAGYNETFDYVVVGGGTAGLAVAYRLSEDASKTVAVIEAGGFSDIENGNRSQVPAYNLYYAVTNSNANATIPSVDWGFYTEPQVGLNNRTLHYGRGKMLGGSSNENAMIYNRGTIGSFQTWADAVGDPDWNFEGVLPYYARSVNYSFPDATVRADNASHVPPPRNSNAYANSDNPLQVSYPTFAVPYGSWAKLAFEQAGVLDQQDFSSGFLLGSQYAPVTVDPKTQTRSSSEASFLKAAAHASRSNLKVYTHTLAKQFLFDQQKRATGVKVATGGQDYVLKSRNETILSAGAFHSPQLLMVSGIGPKAELAKHGIPVLVDRPGVGQGMWDHVDFGPTYEINVQSNNYMDPEVGAALALEYNVNRTGALTSPLVDYIGWEKLPELYRSSLSAQARSDLSKFPSDWPEIEYEITQALMPPGRTKGAFGTFLSIIVAPVSRGTVTLRSSDTRDLPVIDPRFLAEKTDQELVVQIFRRARELATQPAMKPVIIGEEVQPGLSVQTDAQILEYIQNSAYQNWHAACTCKMGRVNDTRAVVDSRGHVIGVSGLRVADASVFASLPPGHPVSTVYMVAEKIAAYIQQGQ